MKEELISFETAKLAKEKGFNEECYHVYNIFDNGNILDSAYDMTGYLLFSEEDLKYANDNGYNCIYAPTQSLLQKWLREVHKIHISVEMGLLYSVDVVYEVIVKREANVEVEFINDEYKTYEEALEVGLQEALNLI